MTGELPLIPPHNHDGQNSLPIDPINLLSLPIFTTLPSVTNAPSIFILDSGGTQKLYVRFKSSLKYVSLT